MGKRSKKKARDSKSPTTDALAEQVNRVFERAIELTNRLVAAEKALRQALSDATSAPPTKPVKRAPARRTSSRRRTTKGAAAPRTTSTRAPGASRTPRAPRRPRTRSGSSS